MPGLFVRSRHGLNATADSFSSLAESLGRSYHVSILTPKHALMQEPASVQVLVEERERRAWPGQVGSKSGSKSGQSQANSLRPSPCGLGSQSPFIEFKITKGQISRPSRPSTLPFPCPPFYPMVDPGSQTAIDDMYKSLSFWVREKSAPYRICTAGILQKRVLGPVAS